MLFEEARDRITLVITTPAPPVQEHGISDMVVVNAVLTTFLEGIKKDLKDILEERKDRTP